LLALGIGLAAAAPAGAQTADQSPRLGGVTVIDTAIDDTYQRTEASSDKATAPLLDTPQTISVIPRELIRERGARTLAEVLRNTPGISFEAGENGFANSSNNFTLRGFDAGGSVFIDNARDSGSYTRDIFNVEAVEVVKGAAADNGRGSAGGYVNLVTKSPSLDPFASGDVSYGFDQYDSKDRKRATIDVNQPIGGSVAVRINGVWEDSGIPGRALAKSKLWGIAPSVALGLGSPLRVKLSFEHVERDDRPDWGVPGATIRDTLAFDPLAGAAPRDAYYGLITDFDDATSNVVLGRIEYDVSTGVTISNQTRWSKVDRSSRFTIPTGFTPATLLVPTSTLFYARENKSLTNLTNVAASLDTGGVAHTISAGVELSYEKSSADRFGAAVPASGNTSLLTPNPGRVGAAPLVPSQTARIDVRTVAVYLYDTIAVSDQFQITGGVRGENYDVEIDSLTAAGAPIGAADAFRRETFSLGGKLALVYKPADNASFYVSAGTSVLPPGSYLSNPDISRTGDNAFPGLVPGARNIRSDNYEIGVKWDFLGGALSTTAALFRSEKRNVPVTGRDVGEAADSLKGYQKQIAQGLELGVAGAVTPEWNIYGGVLVMDTKRKIAQSLDDARRRANPDDYLTVTSTDGDRLAFTPNVSASLWSTYRLPIGLTLGAGVQHVSSSFLGRPDNALRIIPNGRYGKLPAYTIANALIAYDVTDNVELRLNVDNIFNKTYAATTNWNGSRASLGVPRTFLVSAGFGF